MAIRAFVDGAAIRTARNDVKAVVLHDAVGPNGESNPYERHVTVTDEGIVVDIVVGGEVVATASLEHHEILEWAG